MSVNNGNPLQILRSSTPSARPTGRQPGEIYVNFADGQFGYINAAGVAVDVLPLYASTTEARIGTATNRLMSPARVADLSGRIAAAASGTTVLLNGVPERATQMLVQFDSVAWPATQNLLLRFASAGGTDEFYTTRTVLTNAGAVVVAGDGGGLNMTIDNNATPVTVSGHILLSRMSSPATRWVISGALRRSATVTLLYSGVVFFNTPTLSGITIAAGGAGLSGGNLGLQWFITA